MNKQELCSADANASANPFANANTSASASTNASTNANLETMIQPQPNSLQSMEEESLSDQPQPFPLRDSQLPPIIRDIVQNAPKSRKIQSFVACLSPLSALATRLRFVYYYDTRPSAPLLQVIIEGQQSVGKSFAADIERLLMDGTLKARDKDQRRMEQDYREKKKCRKANEKLDEEPQTTIRVIPATVSKTILLKRADLYKRVLGDSLTFWMFADELAQLTDAGRQGYSNLRTIMRTAYDLGSTFGMDYASDNSYSGIADINICSMFCATPDAVDEMYNNRSIEGGNITRIILCPISDHLGADGAKYRPYSQEQKDRINGYLTRIMNDTYTPQGGLMPQIKLDMSWLDRTVVKWCKEMGHQACLSGSQALDVFRKRSSVSAFRVTALCYYLYSLDQTISIQTVRSRCRQIYIFMANYILNNMLDRWGGRYEKLNYQRSNHCAVKGPILFSMLADDFTRQELSAIIQQQNRTTPAAVFLSVWKKNGDIEKVDRDHFKKASKHRNTFEKTLSVNH